MVVILAILAMTALLVLPRLPDSGAAALKTSARTLAATIRYARDQAAVTRLPHRFRFYPGEGRIAITVLPPGGTARPSDDPFLNRRILSEGVTISDIQVPRLGRVGIGEVAVDLGPSGVAELTTIHLKEPGGVQMTITVFPSGGQVMVEEGYREVAQ